MAELEGVAARLAAQRITSAVLKAAHQANELCHQAVLISDVAGFNAANMTFHNMVIKGAKNRLLHDQLEMARPVIFPFRHHISTLPGYMDRAQRLMFMHVNLQGEQVVSLLRLLEKSE